MVQGVTLRYRLFVKDENGAFIPLGETGHECHPAWKSYEKAFGPEVQEVKDGEQPLRPIGVFGLSHTELMQSRWVQNDVLHVKIELAMRHAVSIDILREKVEKGSPIEVPASSLQQNLLALYRDGDHGDVTFEVNGERVQAHAAILSVRSEVFKRELASGLRESTSKEIPIAEIDVPTFKVFLKYLCMDDLDEVDKELPLALAKLA